MSYLLKIHILLLLFFTVNATADETPETSSEIPLYTYHNGGPFIVKEAQGLTYELARYLNQEAKGKWVFKVIKLPRLRFNIKMPDAKIGIVPWVKPAWLRKINLKDDLWSYPYFKDANVIVSRNDNKIDYTGPESLFGYTIVKVKGAVQVGLESYIEQGYIREVNSINFEGHLNMLYHRRADFVSTSLNIAKYMIPKLGLENDLHISMRPIDQYTRHIMVLNGREDILFFINDVIKKMAQDPVWLEALAKFGTAELRVTNFDVMD